MIRSNAKPSVLVSNLFDYRTPVINVYEICRNFLFR